jgi:hypothetical protein
LGEECAEELVKMINASITSAQDKASSSFEKSLSEVEKRIVVQLTKEIADSKISILKYNLLFWVGQLAVTIGILALFYNILR